MSIYNDYEEFEVPESVIFSTRGLLSKWGFGDGDLLNWINYGEENFDSHVVLCHIVREFLVPKLNALVEVVDIGGCHNPIRASSINGIEVDWYEEDTRFDWLQPQQITLTGPEVLQIARQLKEEKPKPPV